MLHDRLPKKCLLFIFIKNMFLFHDLLLVFCRGYDIFQGIFITLSRTMPYPTPKGDYINFIRIHRVRLDPFAPLEIIALDAKPGSTLVHRPVG